MLPRSKSEAARAQVYLGVVRVGVLCLLIDRSLYALKHLLVDSAPPLQRNKHSVCPICPDDLFPYGLQDLSGDPRDPDPKLTGERSTGLFLYQQRKVTFQSERNCLSFSWVKVLCLVPLGTLRHLYPEKIVDSEVG